MKVNRVNVVSAGGVALAKISVKHRQNTNKGMYGNSGNSALNLMNGKRSYNFKKEFDRYVDDHYGDVIDQETRKKLQDAVEDHFNDGCIENVEDLHRHIERIGKREKMLFDL